MKLSSSYDYEWSRKYILNTFNTNYAFNGYQAYDNGFVFGGDNGTSNNNDRQPFLIKTDSAGNNNCNSSSLNFTLTGERFNDSLITLEGLDFSINNLPEALTEITDSLHSQVRCERRLPIPDFSYQQTDSCQNFCINFTNTSLNNPTSFQWNLREVTPQLLS